jgi:hypothetical protein
MYADLRKEFSDPSADLQELQAQGVQLHALYTLWTYPVVADEFRGYATATTSSIVACSYSAGLRYPNEEWRRTRL